MEILLNAIFTLMLIVMVESRPQGTGKSLLVAPTKNPWAINDETPSHVRPIRLYSKQGHYVAISKDGTVTLTTNRSSEDCKFY